MLYEVITVRHTDQAFGTGKGTKRTGLRLLTVGTDCSSGKKYTVLALGLVVIGDEVDRFLVDVGNQFMRDLP